MTLFAAPALPATAYRRSWLLDQLRNARAGQTCLKLLRQVDPRAAALVRGQPWPKVFQALTLAVGQLFPCGEYDDGSLEAGVELDYLLEIGIPVEPMGCSPELGGCAVELIVITLWPEYLDNLEACYTLKYDGHLPWMRTWWEGPIDTSRATQRAPRGRVFTGVWLAVPDLVRWAQHSTGNVWLDTTPEEAEEGYNPPWHIDEIRALAKLWKTAEPVADRIWALLKYVNEAPRERLQLLYRVLRGERAALLEVTVPAHAPRAKTLAEVFLTKEKRL